MAPHSEKRSNSPLRQVRASVRNPAPALCMSPRTSQMFPGVSRCPSGFKFLSTCLFVRPTRS